jgi:hypothetical protein
MEVQFNFYISSDESKEKLIIAIKKFHDDLEATLEKPILDIIKTRESYKTLVKELSKKV